MKWPGVLACLSAMFMVGIIVQALRQEMSLHNAKLRMVQNTAEIKRKEEAILEVKGKIEKLKISIGDVNQKTDDIKVKKDEIVKSTQKSETGLQTCNKEKDDIVKKKTELTKVISLLNANHGEAKKKAEEDIQKLKQQILDRDKAVCAIADTTKEEARKLCGIPESPQ
ncbi:uncharacterized protein si:dkey-87o1.2 [Labrus mixtus]|uniref:uncharacterized protein si:dkey-87o1.2 n=1 Tax=Labrus mixtus TaxID=508554 RepID=UPI0029C0BB6D|nr:uncharacterized protein si:dkey-87o1.2 [Labrus mixtus]